MCAIIGSLLVYLHDILVRLPRRGDTELCKDCMNIRGRMVLAEFPLSLSGSAQKISYVSVESVLDTEHAHVPTTMEPRKQVGGHGLD